MSKNTPEILLVQHKRIRHSYDKNVVLRIVPCRTVFYFSIGLELEKNRFRLGFRELNVKCISINPPETIGIHRNIA